MSAVMEKIALIFCDWDGPHVSELISWRRNPFIKGKEAQEKKTFLLLFSLGTLFLQPSKTIWIIFDHPAQTWHYKTQSDDLHNWLKEWYEIWSSCVIRQSNFLLKLFIVRWYMIMISIWLFENPFFKTFMLWTPAAYKSFVDVVRRKEVHRGVFDGWPL